MEIPEVVKMEFVEAEAEADTIVDAVFEDGLELCVELMDKVFEDRLV